MYDNLRALLKEDGASLTKPRKVVFDLLLDQEPQSMRVLAQRAGGKIDRATLYRTVELFERLGIVHAKYRMRLIVPGNTGWHD